MRKLRKLRLFQLLLPVYILALLLLWLALTQFNSHSRTYSEYTTLDLVSSKFSSRRDLFVDGNLSEVQRVNQSTTIRTKIRRKPILYLHAGPYKTATSFLQCLLSRSMYKFLEMDNITYLGTCPAEAVKKLSACHRIQTKSDRRRVPYCENHSYQSFIDDSGAIRPRIQRELDKIYQKENQDALIVWEYLSDLSTLKAESLLSATKEWDIRLILNYRRLFEWLPSLYSQKHNPDGRPQFKAWPGQRMNFTFGRNQTRKVMGVQRYPFDMYTSKQRKKMRVIDNWYNYFAKKIERTKLHPAEVARRYWKNNLGIQNVTIVDMHHYPQQSILTSDPNADPLLVHLFCSVIPTMHTCRAARENRIEMIDEGRNERFNEHYDLLAIYAHKRGLHPHGMRNLSREDVGRMIEEHHEQLRLNEWHNGDSSFPLKCISNRSLETLYQYSVTTESTVLSDYEDDLKEQFERAVMKRSFCSIDAKKTLDMEQWKNFFRPKRL